MKTKFQKTLLYISSFIPLYFLIIIKELTEIANGNLTFDITNSVMLGLNGLLIALGTAGMIIEYYTSKFKKINIIDYKNITCQNFLPYFPLFVLFALAFQLEFISMAIVYVLILIMVGIVYVKNEMFYINPLLNIIGFSTFEITFMEGNKKIVKKIFAFRHFNNKNTYVNNLFLTSSRK